MPVLNKYISRTFRDNSALLNASIFFGMFIVYREDYKYLRFHSALFPELESHIFLWCDGHVEADA